MDIQQLIAAVKLRPPLWDQSDENYHNRSFTAKLWGDIAGEMGENIEYVKRKWKSLRTVYRLKKKEKLTNSESAEPNWAFYEDMHFLGDNIKPRNVSGDLSACGEADNLLNSSDAEIENSTKLPDKSSAMYTSEISDVVSNQSCTIVSIRKASTPVKKQKTNKKLTIVKIGTTLPTRKPSSAKKKQNTEQELIELERQRLEMMEEQFEYEKTEKRLELDSDDDYSFLMNMLPSMKKLPKSRNLYFRLKMQKMLLDLCESDSFDTHDDDVL